MKPALRPLGVAALTTALVTALSYALPERHAASGVGLAFLAATYVLVLRGDEQKVREFGLSLGGLLESTPLDARRIGREGGRALAWAAALSALVFPFFWIGYRMWWKPAHGFAWVPPESYSDEVLGQILVIALPEEAFYRGYLQTSLDRAWAGRRRLLGAEIGWALPVTSVLFAAGHFLTEPHPNRLAVFFPSLLFGWLRSRTGGVGASIALHAASNMFSATLGRGYGLLH
jgi:membrane protease YdiL (CAAX protease family)